MTAIVAAHDRQSLTSAHRDVSMWVARRQEALEAEVREADAALKQARDRKWATASLANQARRLRSHQTFLAKVAGALDAGYTIMPNFDMTVLAVRTDKAVPSGQDRNVPSVGAVRLPIGQGQYVSPEPEFVSWQHTENLAGGKTREVTLYRATEHAPVDVPFVLVKAGLADRLNEALKSELFDEIGIVRQQPRRDPLLVGRILHPRARHWDRRAVAFFIGWWFDPRELEL